MLAAALMHAGWNAVVRVGGDRFSSILLLSMTQSGLALILLPFAAQPLPAAWPWIAGAGLLHTGYKLFLIRAYQHGDLSQIYPLARGAAPPMVALGGIALFHEHLPPAGWAAVALIALGVGLMAFRGGAGVSRLPVKALAYALGTAVFVASYTLADGQGARIAQTATGFAMWMFVGDGLCMLAYAVATRGPRAPVAVVSEWRTGLPAGMLSLGSYWIALWAFTRAPVALVAALRETSVLFALLIGVFLLKEEAGRWRVAAGVAIAAGVVAMRL
ncbi:EamA family transporter [Phenylobacterium sp.]|uniref:EamA family transporter n=1 Tax=Phenylobacterium sp. TaxID=1871053 RepID=UPI0025E1401E|nr:EamA family transporter [Phenylobacterium sp.]MBX3483429.1 EamA family transporter [Phenylobacterium sp.]MCW5761169.1 EamA family transporter [Phenylobacterium sp.]